MTVADFAPFVPLLSDSVKILGPAVITAVVALVLNRRTQQHELAKITREWKRKLLIEAALSFHEYLEESLKMNAKFMTMKKMAAAKLDTNAFALELAEAVKKTNELTVATSAAQFKLHMVGDKAVNKQAARFYFAVASFSNWVENVADGEPAYAAKTAELMAVRKQFQEAVAAAADK